MTLEAIGAGFGRTGTMSLKVTIEKLGFGPCYHMSRGSAEGPPGTPGRGEVEGRTSVSG
jgi:hypothetical protein